MSPVHAVARNDDPLRMSLAPGVFHVVEASAGTGKTWLTTALVLRLVAEQAIPIERILLITFTRAATAELADRTRLRLKSALDRLEGRETGDSDAAVDLLLAHPDRAAFPARLRQALRDFDLAAISTIHGFSQRSLARLALEAGEDPAPTLLPDPERIREREVADALAITWAESDLATTRILGSLGYTAGALRTAAKAVCGAVRPIIEPPLPSSPPREAIADFLVQYRHLQNVMDTQGAACWAAYMANGADYLPRFGKAQANAYEKLTAAVEAASPKELLSSQLKWFATDGCEFKRPITGFGGLPLMQAYTDARDAAAALIESCLPVAAFAARVADAWGPLLRARGVITYDSMLANLAEALRPGSPRAPELRRVLADQFDVALVDEFQDTDAAQWLTLREVFRRPDRRLVVVGDPKQAIYSFRGADVEVYTTATRPSADGGAVSCWPLAFNHRTDPGLLSALESLWSRGAPGLGPGIAFQPVGARKPDRVHTWGNLPDGRERRPLELRLFTDRLVGEDGAGWLKSGPALDALADDCARQCEELLRTMTLRGDGGQPRPLRPRDLAILVRTGVQGETIAKALRNVGLRGVLSVTRSVVAGQAARWVLAWIDAVADAGRETGARVLALTPLVGMEPLALGHAVAQQLASAEAPAPGSEAARFAALRSRLRRDAEAWNQRGFMNLFERFLSEEQAWPRILALPTGERDATDLRQLLELLHVDERTERDGPAALAERLRASVTAGAEQDEAAQEASAQQLESDADAIRVYTQHVSKGLQFPVVLLPYGWTHRRVSESGQLLRLRGMVDKDGLPQPRVNLAPKGHSTRASALPEAQALADEESMRLLYVAMTRSEHHLIAWIGVTAKGAPGSLWARLGLGDGKPEPTATRAHLDALSKDPNIGWFEATYSAQRITGAGTSAPSPDLEDLPLAPVRNLRNGWIKTSYSGLSRGKEVGLDLAAEAPTLLTDVLPTLAAPAAGSILPRGGTVTGTFVHGLLEETSFPDGSPRSPNDRSLDALLLRLGRTHGLLDRAQHQIVQSLLPAWLDTPLDRAGATATWELPPGFRLRDIRDADRLDELGFDLALGNERRIDPTAVARVFAGLASAEDVSRASRGWAAGMAGDVDEYGGTTPIVGALLGILNGSIDLVFTAPDLQNLTRYWVADYKTNAVVGSEAVQQWAETQAALDPPTDPKAVRGDPRLRNLHYTPPLVDWEMAHHAYPLQSLLYTVALHRFLGQRMGPDYSYAQHVGGSLWLFLRGMAGPSTPRVDGHPLGVWRERWPERFILALDAALLGQSLPAVDALLHTPAAGSPR